MPDGVKKDDNAHKTEVRLMSQQRYKEWESALSGVADLLKGESPRSQILILGAAIENELRLLLSMTLVPKDSVKDELIDRTLGDLSVRIDLAYRLGIISQRFKIDLHLFRSIRNDCAHKLDEFNFDSAQIKDRVNELCSRVNTDKLTKIKLDATQSTERKLITLGMLYYSFLYVAGDERRHILERNKEEIY